MKKLASTFWVLMLVVGLLPLSGVAALATSHTSQAPQGDWVGAVGGDGYVLAGWNSGSDEVSLPAGVTLDVVSGTGFRWVSSTTDVRALEAPDESFRRAATWYDQTQVQATLTFTDAYADDLSVYMVDWNAGGRRQTVTVDDGDGTPVETVIAEDFSGGAWITVPVNVAATGTVTVTATRTAGANAVVSGLFLGGAPVVVPDTVPAAPGAPTTTVVSYAQVDLDWVAPDDGGSEITTYHVWRGTETGMLAKIGTSTTTDYTDTTVAADTSYLYAVSAENAVGEGAMSPETAAVTPAKGFVQAPQGDWVGTVGGDGYVLAGWNSGSDEVSLPAGVTLDVVSGAGVRWVSSTTDVRALEAPDESFRRAATWYDKTQVQATLTFTDAYADDLSVYMVDWDATGRRQTVTVDDGDGTPVETVIAEDFSGGAWITVPVNVAATGTVTITAVNDNPARNAVVSGLFLGGAPVVVPDTVPAAPGAPTTTVVSYAQVDLDWVAPDDGGSEITTYHVWRGTETGMLAKIGTSTTTDYTDTTVAADTSYLYAVSAENAVGEGAMSPETAAVTPAKGFVQAPQGDWVGTVGGDGYVLAGWNSGSDEVSLPAGVTLDVVSGAGVRWVSSTTDVRALEAPDESFRRAATWYDKTQVQATLTFTDAYADDLSVYMVDWDATGRRQTVTVDDGDGTPVETVIAEDFSGGAWITVPVNVAATGTVTITAVNDNPARNAVVSGLFLGGAPVVVPDTVPAAPGAPTTTVVSYAQVDLDWVAPDDGGSEITTYHVWRGTETGMLVKIGTSTTTDYTDTTVAADTSYLYAVSAENAVGEGAMSPETAAVTPAKGFVQAPQGDWVGTVGGDGYVLAGWNSGSDEVSLPAGVTLDVVSGAGVRWVSSTTDVRALEAPDESFRRAATWYDKTQVQATLTFTDAYADDLSVYMVDWDAGGRRQTVTVDDGDGTPVETVIAEDFSGGAWITVPVNVAATGTVTITAVNDNPARNAVVSGLFLGGAPVVVPDTVPAAPGAPTTTVVSYAQVDLDWVAPDDGGSEITTYHVWRGTETGMLAKIGTSTTTDYTDTTVAADTSYLYAVSAENAVGEGAMSPETAAVTPAKGFVQAPQGDWVGTVGGDGYVLAGWNSGSDEVSLPAGVTLDVVSGAGVRWVSSTTDVRALEAPDESFRRAATWYDKTQVQATLTFTDAYADDLSVYMVDWDATGRRQTVTVDDGDGTPVETVIAEDFSGGAWITVPVNVAATGTVTITAVNDNPARNAVVSGLFLGGAPVVVPDTVPAAPGAPTTTVVSYAQVDLDWVAPDDGGSEITTYHVWRGTETGMLAKIGTSTTTDYTDTTVAADTSYLYAVSAENAVGEGAMSPETAAVTPAKGFVQAPQGDWVGTVGGDGYVLAGWNSGSDEVSLPAGVTLDVVSGTGYRWLSSTTDVRALEAPDESFRRAATWYDKTQVQATLTFTDAYADDLSVYMVDWNAGGRRQTVTVDDGDGTPVETVIAEDFSGGAWITVPVNVAATGTVTITATRTAGANAVVSGLFLGGAPVVEPLSAPTGLVATPGSNQVTLTWEAPMSTGGEDITGYQIYRGLASGDLQPLDGTGATTSFVDTTAVDGTPYFYAVAAVTATTEGPQSEEASATPTTP